MILVLAVGAVSAMEGDSFDDVMASEPGDDVVAVSEDGADVIAAEEQDGDVIAASEDEVVAVSEEKEDVIAASENDEVIAAGENNEVVAASENDVVGVSDSDSVVSVSNSDNAEKLAGYGYYKTKVFTLAKFKFPYKYINTKYENLPYKMQKLYDKRYKAFQKKLVKSVKKIKAKGWQASKNPTTQVYKKGSNAIIVIKLSCKKYA